MISAYCKCKEQIKNIELYSDLDLFTLSSQFRCVDMYPSSYCRKRRYAKLGLCWAYREITM